MKKESSQPMPTSAASPSPTMIATTASNNGREAATTVPKTSRRTSSAAGMPMNSPLARRYRRCGRSERIGLAVMGERVGVGLASSASAA